jgi:hypothetical protein
MLRNRFEFVLLPRWHRTGHPERAPLIEDKSLENRSWHCAVLNHGTGGCLPEFAAAARSGTTLLISRS